MKRNNYVIVLLGALSLMWGCENPVTEKDINRQQDVIDRAKERVTTEEKQLDAMRIRKEVESKWVAELDAFDKAIKTLETRAESATGDVEVELRKDIAELRTKYQQMKDKLDELKAASGDIWANTKIAADKAWEDLSAAVKSAVERWEKK